MAVVAVAVADVALVVVDADVALVVVDAAVVVIKQLTYVSRRYMANQTVTKLETIYRPMTTVDVDILVAAQEHRVVEGDQTSQDTSSEQYVCSCEGRGWDCSDQKCGH